MALHHDSQNVLALVVILALFSGVHVQSSSVTNQCLDFCSIGGACLKTSSGPKCICSPEWTGERCDIHQETKQMRSLQVAMVNLRDNLCSFAPADLCNYRGTCYVNDKQFACHCQYPFVGEYCADEDLSECYGYCINNGICNIYSGVPVCTCMPGWDGIRCQRRITTRTTPSSTPVPTTNIPCRHLPEKYCNSGTCIVDSQVRCLCPPNYTGNRCEILIGATLSTTTSSSRIPVFTATIPTTPYTSCTQKPCQNNGQCFPNGNTYFCYCRRPYTGKNCETIMG